MISEDQEEANAAYVYTEHLCKELTESLMSRQPSNETDWGVLTELWARLCRAVSREKELSEKVKRTRQK